MPKRVIIKDSDVEGEAEPVIEPMEETPLELPTPEAEKGKPEDRELETAIVDAEAAYELVVSKTEEIRVREQVTQKRFFESDEMNISVLKKLLQKWDAMRDELIKNIRDAIDRYNRLRNLFEQKFSLLEEELYVNQVELDTIYQLEEQGKPVSVSKKEELEKLIPELREKLVEITQKIKEIDVKIEQLRKMADNVYEITAYKEFSEKIFDQIVDALRHKYMGIEEARVKIRSQIEFLAQREGIPREYAAIYLWKRLKKSG